MSFEVEGIYEEYIMKEKENRIRVPFTLIKPKKREINNYNK